ncbi:MAG TPA: transcriptional regulator GcvA [Mesorhizobium sp.]|jgi:LysR family glycine cleavage system transcriptional activator|nr:transcriptional regulator GcvA [Mesorhizobium sp.]
MARPVPGTRALKVFDAAVRHLNFTRAAAEVGLTPAAVSHQIKEFEDQLGVVLFVRTSRTIRLTGAGAVMHSAVAEALDLLAKASTRAQRAARAIGQLTLTMDPGFASRWMLPRVDDFRRLSPDIDLRFDVSFRLRDFERDDVDLAIRFGAGRYAGLVSHRLFANLIVPVCSPRLLESDKPLREPKDLLHHNLVHLEWTGSGLTWPDWRVWMAAAGVAEFDASRSTSFSESSHVIQAAIDGNVVALADLAMIANDLAAGRLVRPFQLGIKLPDEYGYYLVYPESVAEDARVATFRTWILQEAHRDQSVQGPDFA